MMPQPSTPKVHAELVALRQFLVPRWQAWGKAHRRKVDERGQTMCRFTCGVLLRLSTEDSGLRRALWREVGFERVRVDGGETGFNWNLLREETTGGYFDGRKWHGHYWLRYGGLIIDLTASQFGGGDITITHAKDPRYAKNFIAREVRQHLRQAAVTTKSWAEEFLGYMPPQRPARLPSCTGGRNARCCEAS